MSQIQDKVNNLYTVHIDINTTTAQKRFKLEDLIPLEKLLAPGVGDIELDLFTEIVKEEINGQIMISSCARITKVPRP